MTKRMLIASSFLVIGMSACGLATSVTPTSTPASGIEVNVTEGPMCPGPVAIGDNSCPDKPYQATITILDPNDKLISRFQTDASGYFKIQIAPGTYTLHPESDTVMPHASDQTIVVAPDQFTQVTVIYDTGMR